MIQNKISNDFFNKAILQGQTDLLDSFSPFVKEMNVGGDSFFEIVDGSDHSQINDRIIRVVLEKCPINSAAYGFVAGKSYFDYLKPHISGYYFLRLDVRDFFHSISVDSVKELLGSLFSKSKNGKKFSPYDIALSTLTYKVKESNRNSELRDKTILPKGFSSSPIISNILFRKVDILIQKLCEEKGVVYTRYADDLLFSSNKSNFLHSEQFQREVSIFLSLLSLKLKNRKRKVAENTISLNGYVIQNKKARKGLYVYLNAPPVGTIRLSDKKLKILKKIAYNIRVGTTHTLIMERFFKLERNKVLQKYGVPDASFYEKYAKDQFQNKLKGYRSYLISLLKFEEKFGCVDKKCIVKVKKLLSVFESNIGT